MSKKKKNRVKGPEMVSNPELEAQIKAYSEQPPQTTQALAKAEVTLEKMPNNAHTGEVTRARAANGKFVRTTTASATIAAHKVQKFLAGVDPETGMTRQDSLLHAAYEGALVAAKEPKALGNAVKAVEMMDEIAGHAKVREQQLKDQSNVIHPINFVFLTTPQIMHPEVIKEEDLQRDTKTKPSFAESEVVQQNSATGLDRC